MVANPARMDDITRGLPTKSAKIRKLDEAGYKRAEIAKYLGIRYQHVRNVLVNSPVSGRRAAVGGAVAPLAQKVQLDGNGRIVVPAPFRAAMGVGEGDTLIARLDGDELRLVGVDAALRQVRRMVASYVPEGESLVDALVRERREAARGEDADG